MHFGLEQRRILDCKESCQSSKFIGRPLLDLTVYCVEALLILCSYRRPFGGAAQSAFVHARLMGSEEANAAVIMCCRVFNHPLGMQPEQRVAVMCQNCAAAAAV